MEYVIGKEYVCSTEFGRDLVVYNGQGDGKHFVRGVFENVEEGTGRIMYGSERYSEWRESALESPEQIFSTAHVIEGSLMRRIETNQRDMFVHHVKDGPGWLGPLIRSINDGINWTMTDFVKGYLQERLFDLGRTFWINKMGTWEKVRIVDVMSKRFSPQYNDMKYAIYSTGEIIASNFLNPKQWQVVQFTEPSENITAAEQI